MSTRDERVTPILSDAEPREMFYGKRECREEKADAVAHFMLWLISIIGGWGVLYILWRIGADCLRRLGL